jgi:NAD(P)H-hydrate epimerase
VFLPQTETKAGSLALSNYDRLVTAAAARDMVVLGPGLSLDVETASLARNLAKTLTGPLLIDGDGLSAIGQTPEILRQRSGGTVLTPHLGEMARLTGLSADAIVNDPVGILQKTAAQLGAIIVLKGAHSLIGMPDQRIVVNTTGNHAMATAGSGDVLTGAIAAMAGAGLPLEDAVCAGVALHGRAGDIAAEARGADGVTATDILGALPEAVRRTRTTSPDRGTPAGTDIVTIV